MENTENIKDQSTPQPVEEQVDENTNTQESQDIKGIENKSKINAGFVALRKENKQLKQQLKALEDKVSTSAPEAQSDLAKEIAELKTQVLSLSAQRANQDKLNKENEASAYAISNLESESEYIEYENMLESDQYYRSLYQVDPLLASEKAVDAIKRKKGTSNFQKQTSDHLRKANESLGTGTQHAITPKSDKNQILKRMAECRMGTTEGRKLFKELEAKLKTMK